MLGDVFVTMNYGRIVMSGTDVIHLFGNLFSFNVFFKHIYYLFFT